MIDNQPSPSRPRNSRVPARRQAAAWREPALRRDVALSSRRILSSSIGDPALAALLSAHEPARLARPSLVVPLPPPLPAPVLTFERNSFTPHFSTVRRRSDSIPDSAVTQPLPVRAVPSAEADLSAASYAPRLSHARPAELLLVAACSVAVTLALTWLAQGASHFGEARASIADVRRSSAASGLRSPAPAPSQTPFVFAASIPTVRLADLPLEPRALQHGLAGPSPPWSALSPSSPAAGVNRAELARALWRAAQSAQSCGSGPVQAQIVATFAPSGVARAIHFGFAAPPRALRTCVLNAVARSRVAPFAGEPVTVSKTLSW